MSDYIPVEFLLYIVTKEKTVSRTQNLKYHVKRSDVPEIEPVYRRQITHHTLSILYQNRRKYKEHIGDNSYIRLLFKKKRKKSLKSC